MEDMAKKNAIKNLLERYSVGSLYSEEVYNQINLILIKGDEKPMLKEIKAFIGERVDSCMTEKFDALLKHLSLKCEEVPKHYAIKEVKSGPQE